MIEIILILLLVASLIEMIIKKGDKNGKDERLRR